MSCYCHTCRKGFHSLGIARHRAMHRDRCEDCVITYSDGSKGIYEYAELNPYISTKQHPDSTWSAKAVRGTASIWGYGMSERDAIESLKEDPTYWEEGE